MSPSSKNAAGRVPGVAASGPGLGLAAACLSLFAYATALFITPASNNEIARTFGASLGLLGRLPLALMVGFLVGVAVSGRLADRQGKLPLMGVGNLCTTAGVMGFAMAQDFQMTLLANFVVGLGGGLSETASLALVSDLYAAARRTSMANLSQAMFSAGAVLSPLAVGVLLAAGVDWRWGYVGVAVPGVLAAVLSLIAAVRRVDRTSIAPVSRDSQTRAVPASPILTPTLGLLSLGAALYVGAEIGQSTWLSVLLERELEAAPAPAAAGLSLLWLGLALGRLAAIWVARRLTDLAILRGSLLLATAFEAALLLSPEPVFALAASFGLGVCFGPVFPTIVSAATSARPDRSGLVMSIVVAAGAIGGAIFPAWIGVLADLVGLRPALLMCLALLGVNAAMFLGARLGPRPR